MFSAHFFGKHLLIIMLTIALGGAISIAAIPQLREPVTNYFGDKFGPKADITIKDPLAPCDFSAKPSSDVNFSGPDFAEVGSNIIVSYHNNDTKGRAVAFETDSSKILVDSQPNTAVHTDNLHQSNYGYGPGYIFREPTHAVLNNNSGQYENWLDQRVYQVTYQITKPMKSGLAGVLDYINGVHRFYKSFYSYYNGVNIALIPLDKNGNEITTNNHLFDKDTSSISKKFKVKASYNGQPLAKDSRIKIIANLFDAIADQYSPFYGASLGQMPYGEVTLNDQGEGTFDFSYTYYNSKGNANHSFTGINRVDATPKDFALTYNRDQTRMVISQKNTPNNDFTYQGGIEFIAFNADDCKKDPTRVKYYRSLPNFSSIKLNLVDPSDETKTKIVAKADGQDKIKVKIDFKNSDGTINNAQNVQVYASAGKLSMTGDADKFSSYSADSTLSLLGNREFYILDNKAEKATISAKTLDQEGQELSTSTEVEFKEPILTHEVDKTEADNDGKDYITYTVTALDQDQKPMVDQTIAPSFIIQAGKVEISGQNNFGTLEKLKVATFKDKNNTDQPDTAKPQQLSNQSFKTDINGQVKVYLRSSEFALVKLTAIIPWADRNIGTSDNDFKNISFKGARVVLMTDENEIEAYDEYSPNSITALITGSVKDKENQIPEKSQVDFTIDFQSDVAGKTCQASLVDKDYQPVEWRDCSQIISDVVNSQGEVMLMVSSPVSGTINVKATAHLVEEKGVMKDYTSELLSIKVGSSRLKLEVVKEEKPQSSFKSLAVVKATLDNQDGKYSSPINITFSLDNKNKDIYVKSDSLDNVVNWYSNEDFWFTESSLSMDPSFPIKMVEDRENKTFVSQFAIKTGVPQSVDIQAKVKTSDNKERQASKTVNFKTVRTLISTDQSEIDRKNSQSTKSDQAIITGLIADKENQTPKKAPAEFYIDFQSDEAGKTCQTALVTGADYDQYSNWQSCNEVRSTNVDSNGKIKLAIRSEAKGKAKVYYKVKLIENSELKTYTSETKDISILDKITVAVKTQSVCPTPKDKEEFSKSEGRNVTIETQASLNDSFLRNIGSKIKNIISQTFTKLFARTKAKDSDKNQQCLAKVASPPEAFADDEITYSISVKNNAQTALTDIQAGVRANSQEIDIDPSKDYELSEGTDQDSNTPYIEIAWKIKKLEAKQEINLTFTAKPKITDESVKQVKITPFILRNEIRLTHQSEKIDLQRLDGQPSLQVVGVARKDSTLVYVDTKVNEDLLKQYLNDQSHNQFEVNQQEFTKTYPGDRLFYNINYSNPYKEYTIKDADIGARISAQAEPASFMDHAVLKNNQLSSNYILNQNDQNGGTFFQWSFDSIPVKTSYNIIYSVKLKDEIPADFKVAGARAYISNKEFSKYNFGDWDYRYLWFISKGKLTGLWGDPIPYVMVMLLDEKNTEISYTSSDKDGNYQFDPIKRSQLFNILSGSFVTQKIAIKYCNPNYLVKGTNICSNNYPKDKITNDGPLIKNTIFSGNYNQIVFKQKYSIESKTIERNIDFTKFNNEMLAQDKFESPNDLKSIKKSLATSVIYYNLSKAFEYSKDNLGIDFDPNLDYIVLGIDENMQSDQQAIYSAGSKVTGAGSLNINYSFPINIGFIMSAEDIVNSISPIKKYLYDYPELHEFGHYINDKITNYDSMMQQCHNGFNLNHQGYLNPSTCDSIGEGFAEYISTLFTGDIFGIRKGTSLAQVFPDYLDTNHPITIGIAKNPVTNKYFYSNLIDFGEEISFAHLFWILTNGTNFNIEPNNELATSYLNKFLDNGVPYTFPAQYAMDKKELIKIMGNVHNLSDLYDGIKNYYSANLPTLLVSKIFGKYDKIDELFIAYLGMFEDVNGNFMFDDAEINKGQQIAGKAINSSDFDVFLSYFKFLKNIPARPIRNKEISILNGSNINFNLSGDNTGIANVAMHDSSRNLDYNYNISIDNGNIYFPLPENIKTKTFITMDNSPDYLYVDSDKYWVAMKENAQTNVLDNFATANFNIQPADPDKGIAVVTPPTLEQMQAMEAERQAEIDKIHQAKIIADKIKALEAELAQAKTDQVQAEIINLENQLAQAQIDSEIAKKDYQQKLIDLVKSQNEKLTQTRADYQQATDDLVTKYTNLIQEKQDLVKTQDEMQTAQVEKDKKIESLNSQLQTKNDQIKDLTAELDKKTTIANQYELDKKALEDQLTDQQTSKQTVQATVTQLKLAILKVQNSFNNYQIQDLKDQIADREYQDKYLQSQLALIKTQDQVKDITEKYFDAEQRNQELIKEIKNLEADISKLEDQITFYQSKLDDLQTKLPTSQQKQTELNQDKTNLQIKLASSTSIWGELKLGYQLSINNYQTRLEKDTQTNLENQQTLAQTNLENLQQELKNQKLAIELKQKEQELLIAEQEETQQELDNQTSINQDLTQTNQSLLDQEITKKDQDIIKIENDLQKEENQFIDVEKDKITNQSPILQTPTIIIEPTTDSSTQETIKEATLTKVTVNTSTDQTNNDQPIITTASFNQQIPEIKAQEESLVIEAKNFSTADKVTLLIDNKEIITTPIVTGDFALKTNAEETKDLSLGEHTLTIKDDLGNQASSVFKVKQNAIFNPFNFKFTFGSLAILILGFFGLKLGLIKSGILG